MAPKTPYHPPRSWKSPHPTNVVSCPNCGCYWRREVLRVDGGAEYLSWCFDCAPSLVGMSRHTVEVEGR